MRAVNLVPSDARGASGRAGRSGGAAHALVGLLGVGVVLVGATVMTGRDLDSKRSELETLRGQAAAAERQTARLASYAEFASLRARRVQTVQGLAASRFDWAHAMREVARVIPRDAWLTTMTGTTSPSVNLEGAGSQTGALRSSVQAPALEIGGCTTTQKGVARMIARMRQVDGVRRVSLAASEKAEGSAGDGGGAGGDCRNGSARFPRFEVVVFFEPVAATPAPVAAPAASTADGGTP